jgi:transposase
MKATEADFADQIIWVGIDVHLKRWKVSVWTEHGEFATFSQSPRPEALHRYLAGRFPQGEYRCVYEAGFCGMWIARRFTLLGIDCMVVAPSDVPTTSKERAFKTDPRDARKLARELRKGDLEALYVPGKEEQSDGDLVRTRGRITGKLTRVKNQIKGLLYSHGIEIPERFAGRCWSRNFIEWLTTLAEGECASLSRGSRLALDLYLKELTFLRVQLLEANRTVEKHLSEQRTREAYHLIQTIPGIGRLGAAVIVGERVHSRPFPTENKMASYFGLIPSTHSSGEKRRDGPITRRCNPRLRYVMIESAWHAVRLDLELMADYQRLSKRMCKQQAIIRIARKQMNRLRYVLKNKRPLEWDRGSASLAA